MGNTPEERLVDLARWIFAWQQSRPEMKDAEMIRRFAGLGSAKTYRDLRSGNTGGYDLERWLTEYGIVKGEIDLRDHDQRCENVMTDLSTVVNVRRAALRAMATNGTNRVVIVQGPSGSGKTFALRGMRELYGSRILGIEALDAWNDKPAAMLGEMMEAMGFDNPPAGATERLRKVCEWLRRSRTMVAIDEAQHMGPHCLNTVKALVNRTPGEFMLLCMDTLWSRLETVNYQEARQLSTNRLCERVVLDLDIRDVALFIRHRFSGVAKAELLQMAGTVLQAADNNGNLSFLRGVCETAADMTGDEPVLTREIMAEAVACESARRTKKKNN
jgi:DNA transposition AAA+ family ATPase